MRPNKCAAQSMLGVNEKPLRGGARAQVAVRNDALGASRDSQDDADVNDGEDQLDGAVAHAPPLSRVIGVLHARGIERREAQVGTRDMTRKMHPSSLSWRPTWPQCVMRCTTHAPTADRRGRCGKFRDTPTSPFCPGLTDPHEGSRRAHGDRVRKNEGRVDG